MPRVSDAYRVNRRAEIVGAAGRRFTRNGFHATSMADIIEESGLSAGAVYRYFQSKEEIIGAVAETALRNADAIFAGLLADGAVPTPAHAVTTVIETLIAQGAHDPDTGQDLTRIALQVWAEALRNPDLHRRAGEAAGQLRAQYAEVARRWQAAGNLPADAVPEHVGAAMLGLTQGFLLQRLLVPDTSVAGYASGLQALLAVAQAGGAAVA
jgi:AcrR family transcriptional regulator